MQQTLTNDPNEFSYYIDATNFSYDSEDGIYTILEHVFSLRIDKEYLKANFSLEENKESNEKENSRLLMRKSYIGDYYS